MSRPRTRRPRAWRRPLIGTVTAAALVAAGAAGGWWWATRDATASAAAVERTQLVAASLDTVKQTVSASGTIEPRTQATAAFTSSGTVASVTVEVGDTVRKGQALATVDDSDLSDAVTLAKASVNAAQDQVDTASTTQTTAQADAQLASAQSQLADAEAALDGATLRAPVSGTVASVGYAVGDSVGSSGTGSTGANSGSGGGGGTLDPTGGSGSSTTGSSGSSTTGIEVVNTSTWEVQASVSSSDLETLKKGLQATITPTGGTEDVFGTVRSIGVVASSSSSGTTEFPVVIDVTGKPKGLHAGTTATVAITVKQLTDVLTVPTQAVRTENGATTVQVSKDGAVSSVPVTVGGVYGTSTVITDGLAEGDQVVVTLRTPTAGTGQTQGGDGRGQFPGGGFPGGGFPGGGFPAGGPPGGAP